MIKWNVNDIGLGYFINLKMINANIYTNISDDNNKIIEEKDVCEEVEDYEVWKERILKEAYAALKINQH